MEGLPEDLKWLINFIFIIPLTWLWHKMNNAERRHNELEKNVFQNYVSKEDIKDVKADLRYVRDRIDLLVEKHIED